MPGYDGSGPMGSGSMTGGARGYCIPGIGIGRQSIGANGFCRRKFSGRGFRGSQGSEYDLRRSLGRGFWNAGGYYEDTSDNTTNEINMLKSQANFMRKTLESIEKQISEIEKSSSRESDKRDI
jgi:hypothetical protein